ncbi:MAG: helix-turn-helix domain-containing protein [Fimbriiglobus sp.]|jgi:transcriptional regulator with XRE-family HTH domain|nr:helix-turn-helix domain-containing protein [Fimbriiglobus sp.]
MVKSTAKLIDQLEADREARQARGEFLFEGAGEVLAELREKRGWSLAKVGDALGVAASTVMRYEKNEMPLSDYAVTRFAEVYEVDAERLMIECMERVLPGMKDSAFGKLLEKVIESGSGNS